MVHENSLKNLLPFSSQRQPKNPGRKPSKLKKFLKENNLFYYDSVLIAKSLLGKSMEELEIFAKDKTQPIMISGAAMALLKDMVRGKVDVQIWLYDRAWGKSTQPIEVAGGIDPVQQMTPEERSAWIDERIRMRNERKDNSD